MFHLLLFLFTLSLSLNSRDSRELELGSWSLVETKSKPALQPTLQPTTKFLLREALSRIAPERMWEGTKSIPAGAVFLGGFWRIIKVTKNKKGRPESCTLVIDDSYNVIIEGAKDKKPLCEAKLGYELWRLADAIICILVFPEEAKKMLEEMSRQEWEMSRQEWEI